MKLVPDQVQRWIPGHFITLGTDGYGRSDGREALRDHFEVDARYIVLATVKALMDTGEVDKKMVVKVIKKYKLDPNKINPEKV